MSLHDKLTICENPTNPKLLQGFALNKINFLSKLEFYPRACFILLLLLLFLLFKYLCINNAPLTLPKAFRTDANSKELSSVTLSLNIFNLGLPSYHRGFLGTLTCLTPKKKCTYVLHTISPVKMCCSQQFGRLQQNICRLLHTSKTSSQDEVWSLLPITIASLPSLQKKFPLGLGYMCETALLKEINEL